MSSSYISDALQTAVPGAGTNFSNSEGRSLAVINPGETVIFGMKDSQTKHTITTLIYPAEAEPLGGNGILTAAGVGHFDQQLGIRGSTILSDDMGNPTGLDLLDSTCLYVRYIHTCLVQSLLMILKQTCTLEELTVKMVNFLMKKIYYHSHY